MKITLLLLLMGLAQLARAQNSPWSHERQQQQQLQSDLQNQQSQLDQLRMQNELQQREINNNQIVIPPQQPLVEFVNGVPQPPVPPVLSNSIKSGTQAENKRSQARYEARVAAYKEALLAYNDKIAREQKAAQQMEALRQEIARLATALQKANQLATEQAQPKPKVAPKRAAP